MSNPYPAFADLKTDDIVVKSLSQNKGGKGQSCFIDINPKFGNSLTAPKDLRSLWNIKPSGESVDDVFSFNIELALPPEGERSDVDSFRRKVVEVDNHFLNFALKNKNEFFGSQKAKSMSSTEVVRGSYTPIIKEGKESKDGSKYDDSIHGKIYGWKDQVDSIVMKECTVRGVPNTKMVDGVVWKPRICDGRNFGPSDTHFYLFMGKDIVTNQDTFTDKVPMMDAAGKPTVDASGNTMYRWVGPGDCVRGSKVTIVFNMSKLYVSANFGPINAIREVYIKPSPPRERGILGGAKIVQVVDPLQAARALQALMNSEVQGADGEQDDEEYHPVQPSVEQHHEEELLDAERLPSSTSSNSKDVKEEKKKRTREDEVGTQKKTSKKSSIRESNTLNDSDL